MSDHLPANTCNGIQPPTQTETTFITLIDYSTISQLAPLSYTLLLKNRWGFSLGNMKSYIEKLGIEQIVKQAQTHTNITTVDTVEYLRDDIKQFTFNVSYQEMLWYKYFNPKQAQFPLYVPRNFLMKYFYPFYFLNNNESVRVGFYVNTSAIINDLHVWWRHGKK